MMPSISKETFEKAETSVKLDILFDYQSKTSEDIKEIKELLKSHPTDCGDKFKDLSERTKKIENKKHLNSFFAGTMGLLGGFIAMIAKIKFWE